jgi:hypothetical protein
VKAGAEDSHHVSISTYHKSSWYELLNVALPASLQAAFDDDIEFRRGLPLRCSSYMGQTWARPIKGLHTIQNEMDVADGKQKSAKTTESSSSSTSASWEPKRAAFRQTFLQLFRKLEDYLEIDNGVDSLALEALAHRLPPPKQSQLVKEAGGTIPEEMSEIRLVDPRHMRMVVDYDDESGAKVSLLFTCIENNREQHMQGVDEEGK